MATAAAPEPLEPSEMECSVCHEYFTKPKILPCAHLLCQHCLVSWLNSHPDAHCPLCRCAIVDPQEPRTSRSVQEVVDALPTDVTMAGLVAGARALSQDHVCVVCQDVAADFICLDCNDMLCQACNKAHGRLASTKNHTTADLATMTPERLAASRHVTCTAHAQQQATIFCASHNEAICHFCATIRHRACADMRELEEKVSDVRNLLGELLELLTSGEIQLEAAIRELDDHLLQMEKKTERTLADITATCDDLKKAVDAFGSQMREAALSAKCKAREEVEQVKSAFMQRKGKLTSHKQLVKRSKRVATPSTSDGDVTSLKTRVEGLDCSVTLPDGVNVITMPMLVLDQQAIERVKMELKGVCKLENTPAKLSFLHAAKLPFQQTATLPFQQTATPPLQAVAKLSSPQAVAEFCFHDNHGTNIVLSNNKKTAERGGNGYNAIVLSSQPMEVHQLYEVVIEQVARSPYSMMAGVTAADPSSLTMPGWAKDLPRESSVILCNDSGWSFVLGTRRDDIGKKLKTLPVGGRAGFCVDAARSLHLVVDGCDQGVVCKDVPQPCYSIFGLVDSVQKVTALPPTRMA